MTHSIESSLARVQWHARQLSGMAEAPELPPEKIAQYPFALSYLRSGETTLESGWLKTIDLIFCEFHFPRNILPRDIARALPFRLAMLERLHDDPNLDGACSTIVSPILTTFGLLAYGGVAEQHLGWRFEITVKLQQVAS